MRINTSAKKLKVTAVIDAAPFAALHILDSAPPRTEIMVRIGEQTFWTDVTTKSLRKAVKALAEAGAGNVALII
jgi:hypothetical protein